MRTLSLPTLNRRHKVPSGVVGLDVDGGFLAAAVLTDGAIGTMASVALEPGITTDGEVRDPTALSRAIKDLFADHGLPRRVRLGVANQQIVVRQLEMPVIVDSDDREAAIRFQAAEAIAMPLDEAVLDYQTLGEVTAADGTKKERLLIVAARESMVAKLVDAVKGAGLKPAGIDLNAFALVRMLGQGAATGPDVGETAQVLCHLGTVTNLAIASGSACLFTRPLQTAWQGDESAIGALVEEIRLSVDFYMAQPEAKPVDGIILSGPGARDELLATELPVRSGFPVTVAEPLGAMSAAGIPAGDDPYRFTVAAGLALGETA
jgi:type IV pilus assembly protein PilM